jgi:hypothetical protein
MHGQWKVLPVIVTGNIVHKPGVFDNGKVCRQGLRGLVSGMMASDGDGQGYRFVHNNTSFPAKMHKTSDK